VKNNSVISNILPQKYSKRKEQSFPKLIFLKVFHPLLSEPGTPPCGSLGQYIQVSLG
jgi:hypothetical protein